MIAWDASMTVGCAELDESNRNLIDIINAFQAGESLDRGRETAKKLLNHTLTHFPKEEAYWARTGSVEARQHRNAHEKIAAALMNIIRQSNNDDQASQHKVIKDLQQLTHHWLHQHLMTINVAIRGAGTPSALAATKDSAADAAIDYGNIKVLVVDDETDSRGVLVRMLNNFGIESVREATDGSSAFHAYREFSPNLLLCDLDRTPVDGLSLAHSIRTFDVAIEAPPTPVIFVTGQTDPENARQAAQLKSVAYLSKPVTIKTLKTKIDAIFTETPLTP